MSIRARQAFVMAWRKSMSLSPGARQKAQLGDAVEIDAFSLVWVERLIDR